MGYCQQADNLAAHLQEVGHAQATPSMIDAIVKELH